MRGAWVILKKDCASYCRSWVGVLSGVAFLVVSGIFFTLFLLGYSQLSFEVAREAYEGIEGLNATGFVIGAFLLNLGVLFLFIAPFLSMRSLAEEKRVGTLELLYTYPLSDFEIVLGKFLALLAQGALLFLPTLGYLILLRVLGTRLDGGIVLGGTLGFFLLAASFLALGLLFSSLTENQMLAAGLTFVSLMVLWMLEWLTGLLPPPWNLRLVALSPFGHFRDFSLGIIDTADMVYFLGLIAFFFFLTQRIVETRNWRG